MPGRHREAGVADGHEESVLDTDCPELENLGVRYLDEETEE